MKSALVRNIFKMTLVAPLLLLPFGGAVAQTVYRCMDADGVSTYQDLPCEDRDAEARMQIKPNVVDSTRARANVKRQKDITARLAAEREQRAQARQQAQNEMRSNRQSRPSKAVASGPCPPGQIPLNSSKLDGSRGWSDSKGYVNLECGSPDDRLPDQDYVPERGRTPEPPAMLVNCDKAGCWDTQGNRHTRAGDATTIRSDGKICTRISPTQVQCN